jgi:predicted Zn-ribbon and HTH transcriptional regulator
MTEGEPAEENMKTAREELESFLEHMSEPTSVAEILGQLPGYTRSEDFIDDINHALKSLKAKGVTFKILPAHCRFCNFTFKTTKMEVKIPSKCPSCRAEEIIPPVIERKP